jgi:hypothetical protein
MLLLIGYSAEGGSPARAGGPVPVVPVPAPTSTATTWFSIKRGGHGAVTGLMFHPTATNVLHARTDVGGAYRWDPTTMSWAPITNGVGPGAAGSRFHGIESIALDPNDDQPLYIATRKQTFEANGRIFVSSDHGHSWTHVDLPFPLGDGNPGRAMGERPMVVPHLPSTLFHGARTAGL